MLGHPDFVVAGYHDNLPGATNNPEDYRGPLSHISL